MANSIAEYYIGELDDWKETLDFDAEQIDEMQEELEKALLLNTIIDLAGKVEHQLNQLRSCKQNLVDLHIKLNAYEKRLYKGRRPAPNEMITEEITNYQRQIRREMHEAEIAYTDVKYDVNTLLANTIAAQNSKHNHNSFPTNNH